MRLSLLWVFSLLICVFSPSNAATISAIYSFGDSLTDTGNDFAATGGLIAGSPYFAGRFSNGPIWIDDLALSLGLSSQPSLLGGTNFAYGGAETGATPVHAATQIDILGPQGQLAQFTATHPVADANALYTIWIGSNDLRDVLSSNPSPAAVQADIGAIVTNIDTTITQLAVLGARNFLILTVPDLGKSPSALSTGPAGAAAASAVAAAFDNALVFGSGPLPSLASLAAAQGLTLRVLDTYTILDSIVASGAALGFTNATSPCLIGATNYSGGVPCSADVAAQNKFVFWDDLHPTSAAHAIVGANAIGLETPEPATLLSLAGGLMFIWGSARWSKRRRAGLDSPQRTLE